MRILVGVDGSEASLIALEQIRNTVWPTGTQVRLVGAYELPVDWTGAAPFPSGTGSEDEAQSNLVDALQALVDPLRRSGHAADAVLARGRAADVLLAEAEDLHADLIVVGSRGLGVAASALLGSVSSALVDNSACPVLVARVPAVTRILLATDGSRSAEAIPAVLLAWNVFRDARIRVLSVAPPRSSGNRPLLPSIWTGDDQAVDASHEVDRHRVMAGEMAARLLAGGWLAEGAFRRGEAAREIEAAAVEWGADLIITGSRGLSGLRRLLLGSVAHHVLLHSEISVLVMRGHVPSPERRAVQRPATAKVAG